MADVETECRSILESYAAAVRAKDAVALTALYDDEVRVFDAWAAWSYEGAAAWAAMVRGWLGSLGAETVAVRWQDVRIAGAGDAASVSAIVTYASVLGGVEQRSMQNRLSWVLARRPGGLRIVHEHTSAPIGMDDMKAILQRAPAP